MNFLAHAYLSPAVHEAPGVLVGNLVADFVKGRARHALPADVQQGIALHRRIDGFTDLHPIVLACAERLEPRWGRYAPVLVDIFFDHCLAARWVYYSPEPLADFTGAVYAAVEAYRSILPPRAQLATQAMALDNWLSSYRRLDGIARALERLSRRLRHGVELGPAAEDLRADAERWQRSFADFFGQLQVHMASNGRSGHDSI